MLIKKVRKIYRILFPAVYSMQDILENCLRPGKVVKNVTQIDGRYKVQMWDDAELIVRDSNHSDYLVFNQIFNMKEYEGISRMISLNNSSKRTIVIDAGANVGYTSVFFASKLTKPLIYAIEPSKDNSDLFLINTSNYRDITLFQRALWPEEEMKFSLSRNFRDGADWSFTTEPDIQGGIVGITMNEIISEQNLDYITLLKIDIEGAERFLFREHVDLSFLNITEIIAIEIHNEFGAKENICSILKSYGFFLMESGELTIGINKNFTAK